jgi:molybdopterin-guanine dinucleotide biosynthesis protein A
VESDRTSLEPVDKSNLTVILLTGGSSRRMGRDKASLEFGNHTLLKFQLEQVPNELTVIVVGEPIAAGDHITFIREDPAGSGPVAAVAAAMALVNTPLILLLAVDAPFAMPRLLNVSLASSTNALIPVDRSGHAQYLAGIYRTDPLRIAVNQIASPVGVSVRELMSHLPCVEYREIPPGEAEFFIDLDTPEDLAIAREILGRHPKVGP